jgi:hypothetical protein
LVAQREWEDRRRVKKMDRVGECILMVLGAGVELGVWLKILGDGRPWVL